MATNQNNFKTTGIFWTYQGRFFKNSKKESKKLLNAEDATIFWKGIWSTKVERK